MSDAFAQLTSTAPVGNPHFWHERAADVRIVESHLRNLVSSQTLSDIRKEFGYVSDALDRIVAATGVPPSLGTSLDRRICGMAPDVPRSGVWLQSTDENVRNPYFGNMMLRCNLPSEHRRLPLMESADEVVPAGDAP